ncbi:MAG: TIR domain-containing protein [Rikenellaceae bacterium]|nr:TIR domain-containing protein [Rikenellaceae bacterium]
MKHDVFISYSRKDIKITEGLCEVLRQNGVDYWIDDNNIHGSANFLSEITKNLKQCKAVIFVASANSAASEWTQKELLFAIKHSKDIIPYKIGEFSFDDNDELDFVFSNVQWVDSIDKVIVALREKGFVGIKPVLQPPVPEPPVPPTPKPRLPWWLWVLIAALAVAVGGWLLGGDRGTRGDLDAQQHQADSLAQVVEVERHRSDSLALVAQRLEKEKAEKERIAREKAEKERIAQEQKAKEKADAERKAVQQETKTYKVGDYYDDGVKQGVVFQVWDDGRHGKIVSLDETELQWCTDEQYNKKIVVGAESNSDGKANTDRVMARSDADQYPAFVWCRNKGKDWYLPAIEELELLLLSDPVLIPVNSELYNKGGKGLHPTKLGSWFWSSNEQVTLLSEYMAFYVDACNEQTNETVKRHKLYVRAVATF